MILPIGRARENIARDSALENAKLQNIAADSQVLKSMINHAGP
jgi:hypothetical protein